MLDIDIDLPKMIVIQVNLDVQLVSLKRIKYYFKSAILFLSAAMMQWF